MDCACGGEAEREREPVSSRTHRSRAHTRRHDQLGSIVFETLNVYSLPIPPHIEINLQIPPPPQIPPRPPPLPHLLPASLPRPFPIVRIIMPLHTRLSPTRLQHMPDQHHRDGDAEGEGEDPLEGVADSRGHVGPGGVEVEGGEEEGVAEGGEEEAGEDEVGPVGGVGADRWVGDGVRGGEGKRE